MSTKICSKCKREFPTTKEYRYTSKTTKDWWYSPCKECKNKYFSTYHQTEWYRELRKIRINNNWEHIYKTRKEKNHNWIYKRTKRAVDEIWRPNVCPICRKEWDIQTHHVDYNKWYEIVFCCTRCHNDIHLWKIKDYKITNLLECKQP